MTEYEFLYRLWCGDDAVFDCTECQTPLKNWRSLTTHMKNKHKDIWVRFTAIADATIANVNNNASTHVACPLCGYRAQSIVRHVEHEHGVNTREYSKRFPLQRWVIYQTRKGKQASVCCVFSRREFVSTREMSNAQRRMLPEIYATHTATAQQSVVRDSDLLTSERRETCAMCNKLVYNLKTHAKLTHRMEWHDYCERNLVNPSKKFICTERHRQRLSNNKVQFYWYTPKGAAARDKQSSMFKQNNPGQSKKSREVNSILSLQRQKYIEENSYGCRYKWRGISFRSTNEILFYALCLKSGISADDIQHEPFYVSYVDSAGIERTYIPDFIVQGQLFEIKPNEFIKTEKYRCIEQQLNVRIVTINDMQQMFNVSKMAIRATLHELGSLIDAGEINASLTVSNGRNTRLHKKLRCKQENIILNHRKGPQ